MERKNIRYPKWELESLIDPVLDVIIETLSHGEEIRLNKFDHFFIQHEKGSPYYNINTVLKEIVPDKKTSTSPLHKGFHFDDSPSASEPGSVAEDRAEDKKE